MAAAALGGGDHLLEHRRPRGGLARSAEQPRHEVNPWTGEWDFWAEGSHLAQGYHDHDPIEHRLQVHDADLEPSLNPDATYYVESLYCPLLNVDMDREVDSFSVPLPVVGVSVSEIGFHAVESHDEPYSNEPWTAIVTGDAITWSTEGNPLRWGTLYDFRFNADYPAEPGIVTLGLHKPGTPEVVTGSAQVPTSLELRIVHGQPGD